MKYVSKGNEYFVDEEFLKWLNKEWKGYIVVIGGPSGVGKTTLSEKLGYEFVTSFTTRNKRKEYETYDFISHKEYCKIAKEGAFATGVKFGARDNYGVTKERFKEAASRNDVLIITMSPLGYRLLKTRYPKTIGVFVSADYKVVEKRLLKRDGELDEVRVASYANNMRSRDYYHIQVNNNRRITLGLNVLKVRLLVSLMRYMDKSKNGHKLRKKWFYVLKDNMFSKQAKERARLRKKREQEERVRRNSATMRKTEEANELAMNGNVVQTNISLNEAANNQQELTKVVGGN